MPSPGPKRKPAEMRLVVGTHRLDRHGDREAQKELSQKIVEEVGPLGPPPKEFRGDRLKIWKEFIAPLPWLDSTKRTAAVCFVELWFEFRNAPQAFVASKHAQMRAYMGELGMTDERNRGTWSSGQAKKKTDDFFDD